MVGETCAFCCQVGQSASRSSLANRTVGSQSLRFLGRDIWELKDLLLSHLYIQKGTTTDRLQCGPGKTGLHQQVSNGLLSEVFAELRCCTGTPNIGQKVPARGGFSAKDFLLIVTTQATTDLSEQLVFFAF